MRGNASDRQGAATGHGLVRRRSISPLVLPDKLPNSVYRELGFTERTRPCTDIRVEREAQTAGGLLRCM